MIDSHQAPGGGTTLGDGEVGRALPRRLGLASLILIVVAFNSPIGTMAGFAQLSVGFGNGIGAPVAFLVAGALLLTFAVGFVGMSRHVNNPGAFYRLIVAGLGRPPGLAGAFLATAAYILLCAGTYPYIGLVAVDFMTRLTGSPVMPWQGWALVLLVIITTLGLLRVDLSIKLLSALVCLEVFLVALWEIAVALKGGPEGYSPASYTLSGFLHESPGLGVLFAMLTMVGIEAAVCFRDEAINPDVTVGRATYYGIGFLAVLYSIGTWAYIVTQGASHAVAAASTDPIGSFVNSMQRYLGNFFVSLTSLAVVTSTIVCINAMQGAASRYLYSLGRDQVLPSGLAAIHPRFQSPHVAVLTVALLCLVIVCAILILDIKPVTAYAGLTGMGIFFLLPLLIMTSVAILVFYWNNGHLPAGLWTRFIAPITSTVLLSALFLLTSTHLQLLVSNDFMSIISLVGVVFVPACGFVLAYFLRARRPRIYWAF